MEFRKATVNESPQILQMYKAAIRALEDKGIYQWDDIYPSEKISEDIKNEEMYIGVKDGDIAAAFTLNQQQDEQYINGEWAYEGERFRVLHRLCVNPAFQNMGIATKTGKYIEEMLRSEGFGAIRLDAFSKNPASLRLYEKLGYIRVGETHFIKGRFYLFEKVL